MREVWLRKNVRALAAGMIWPALAAVAGLAVVAGAGGWIENGWFRAAGGGLLLVSLVGLGVLALQMRKPRLSYAGGYLLLDLRPGGPIRVPIDLVEGFLMGRGASGLGGRAESSLEATTVVIRFAERAPEWERVEVDPRLGSWCGHYATLRGAWCEPLNVALVERLNARLYEAQQAALHPSSTRATP